MNGFHGLFLGRNLLNLWQFYNYTSENMNNAVYKIDTNNYCLYLIAQKNKLIILRYFKWQ